MKALPPDVAEHIEQILLDANRPDVQFAIGAKFEAVQGPIPPAHQLIEYREISPDLPGRIVGWAEDQARHRKQLEVLRCEGAERRMDRSQYGALTIAVLSVLVAAAVSLLGGSSVVAIGIALIGVGGPSTASILARFIRVEK